MTRPLLGRFSDVVLWLLRCPVTWCVGAMLLGWWVR